MEALSWTHVLLVRKSWLGSGTLGPGPGPTLRKCQFGVVITGNPTVDERPGPGAALGTRHTLRTSGLRRCLSSGAPGGPRALRRRDGVAKAGSREAWL